MCDKMLIRHDLRECSQLCRARGCDQRVPTSPIPTGDSRGSPRLLQSCPASPSLTGTSVFTELFVLGLGPALCLLGALSGGI